MLNSIRIFLAQINNSVGDLQGNTKKIFTCWEAAEEANCDLVIFPEMTICGYPCLDLWQKPFFIKACQEKISELAEKTKNFNSAAIIGSPTTLAWSERNEKANKIFNSAILLKSGKILQSAHKKSLPNYGVFDEMRYFQPANSLSVLDFLGFNLALLICEDMWDARNLFLLTEREIDAVLVINSSPFEKEKFQQRQKIAKKFTTTLKKPLIYLNQVGGQDSLVFDGASFVLNPARVCLKTKQVGENFNSLSIQNSSQINTESSEMALNMSHFANDFKILNLEKSGFISKKALPNSTKSRLEFEFGKFESLSTNDLSQSGQFYQACVLGLRDYIRKNGANKVLLGLSGGVDSALVACIAVDALGAQNVSLYALPTRFNPKESLIDAQNCAKNLGAKLSVIDIDEVFENMLQSLKISGEAISDLAIENLQARIRGNFLMSFANSSGALLLSTSNKSEIACGYGTLYGDMCGAFNPIKDLYKTEIYQLANWRNLNLCQISKSFKSQVKSPIPARIISKDPSAELREGQKDSDSLPPYEILDKILFLMIEEQQSVEKIIDYGFDKNLVLRIAKLVYANEFKRNQAVIGVKLSKMSFDKERRYPITNKFRI